MKLAHLGIGPGLTCCLLTFLSSPGVLPGQTTNLLSREPGNAGEPLNWTTQQDHKNMMDQLGIIRLRPGPSGQPGMTNSANYDSAKANPFPDLPEVLTLKNGQKVTSAEMWWKQRRPELVEDFEREVIGRVPKNVPKVTWTVVSNATDGLIGDLPANGKRLVGHVDNSTCPSITVDIRMTVVTPAQARHPVPVLMMFGGFGGDGLPRPAGSPVPTNRFREFGGPYKDPPSTEQLLAAGWGYATINPGSIQADDGAGLTRGIIGLVNKGQPRKPDDWGSLRAWAWGAARGLDYLETDPAVDAKKVGIEGVSRFGKAALVAMAFEPRFAMALVGSSGEGGAKLHRRNFGEAVENLTGSGEYHWMAGNFLKYGASESSFGSRNAGDLPVDAHMLIALCAPQFTFISYGIPARGDANWLDQQGSYMATVAAGPVFRLLGARDIGEKEDYRTAKMPPVNTGLLDGELAWRQHDGGHEDRSNMKYFIAWANRLIKHSPPPTPAAAGAAQQESRSGGRSGSASRPQPRTDSNSLLAHQQLVRKAKQGGIDVFFVGDSIIRRWGATDPQYQPLLENWKTNFFGWNAANFGWGADRIENILWRLENGELDGVNPKVIVVLAGINNVGTEPGGADRVEDITQGLRALLDVCQARASNATVIMTAIFPRNDNMAVIPSINQINRNIARMADGRKVRYLDINDKLADKDGRLFPGMMNADQLHPTLKAYQVWADALKPMLTDLLGPPAKNDHAPPPTGDPSSNDSR
ncbi:MAG TPA: GDSL-type esterase/lipase family protein [Candidatus Acidoferrum sp.]|jgi:lysophospholipase L1-like esterase|nr:GDSL-type esterase/lipase family protein [Candidatus Acidoferrum sp.]